MNPGPSPSGYDGWMVIDLDSDMVIRINERAEDLLGVHAGQLPADLDRFVTDTDLGLLKKRVLPLARSGSTWQGGLRIGDQPVDLSPSPSMLVPHVREAEDLEPEFASLLFASAQAADVTVLVPDPLTGLPTRSALLPHLDSAVQRNRDSTNLLAVLFLDLDGLKIINDRYGHDVGDTALIETAQRISSHLPAGGLAVRFGGDEFVIVYEGVEDLADAQHLAEQILAALDEAGDYHAMSASIGIAVSRGGQIDSDELIRQSDTAMYRAKARGGRQVAVFDEEMRAKQRDDEELRSSILQAISNNGFGVAAQPIFELATGRIYGVELFIRVRDDIPYIANANQLFRLAHEYGEALDTAVLGRALELATAWRRSLGDAAPRVQINISTQSLAASQFAQRVGDALAGERIRPGAIAFEIDGRDLATAGERERSTVEGLRELGAPIVVDGFGDGTLTLQDLADWAPAMIKIDASSHSCRVLAGLVRSISTLQVASCVKGLGQQSELQHAVGIGAFAGQGNALTPVRQVERLNAQIHGPQRLGF
jgi:diguanylate cyclase (GGDEF)-like protein